MVDVLPDDAPSPRLCHLIKWPDFDGYGFNLHAERSNPGQFIGKIDQESPAQMAGLREGDRIVEVNGVNISNENHRQVVERIKSDPNETKLLVVDPETDLWYREQDLVVKSSQMNVIYKKTPVPRPKSTNENQEKHNQGNVEQATSMVNSSADEQLPATSTTTNGGASSLETTTTSDFASVAEPDSIEPATKTPPPMSPDSGKGDEVPEQRPVLMTVEAEINHQSKPIVSKEIKQQEDSTTIMQPDSLSDDDESAKDRARQVHNGSADSGKSSSPDGASGTSSSSSSSSSSSGGSIADSLEDHAPSKQQDADLPKLNNITTATGEQKDSEQVGATKTVIKPTESETTPAPSLSKDQHQQQQQQLISGMQSSKLSSTLTNNNVNHETIRQPDSQRSNVVTGSRTTTAKTNNNNYSGLNLNMTASEMRELLARRKKFDPKKAQMNIRQKYEIIQQM